VKKGQAIFTFKLKNDKGDEQAWYIDLKESGKVAKGEAPAGKKADGRRVRKEVVMGQWLLTQKPAVILSLSDENFGKMVTGKTKAQALFMGGKLKIRGNVMKGKTEDSASQRSVLTCGTTSHEDGTDPVEGPAQGKTIDSVDRYRHRFSSSIFRRWLRTLNRPMGNLDHFGGRPMHCKKIGISPSICH